ALRSSFFLQMIRFIKVLMSGKQCPDNGKHLPGNGYDNGVMMFFHPFQMPKPEVKHRTFRSGSTIGTFHQGFTQILVPVCYLAALNFSCAFIIARSESCP